VTALDWEGCVNVRDLGGLPTEDGRETRPGRLVRADNLRRLSDAGWRALADAGVRRIVDLRFPEELAEDPPRDVDVEVVHVSLLGPSRTAEWQDEFNAALDQAATAEEYLVWSYLEFLERYRAEFGRVFAALAEAPRGAVAFHCLGGKDRTGLVAALALRLAGVPLHEVAADYALTEANLAPGNPAWVDAAPDAAERRRRELLLPSPPSAMRRVLEELERRYGGTAGYLRACGVPEEDLERLRRRLLEP
jgi:protein tyrosine/serine phosphatase